jgi:hypothetical protein
MGFYVNDRGEVNYSGKTLDEAKDQIRKDAEVRAQRVIEEVPNQQAKLETCWRLFSELKALSQQRPTVQLDDFCDTYDITVKCQNTDLAFVAKVAGKIKVARKEVEDAKKKLVRVVLRSEQYPFVYVQYMKKLPRGAKGQPPKCRIKTVTEKRKVLVCDL